MATTASMAENRPRKRADAQRNRETVIETAISVLAERPQASMRDIADASGLGRTTVYRHFATRDDLVRALFERVVAESSDTIRAAAEPGGPAADVLRRLARELVALSDRYRFLEHHRSLRSDDLPTQGDNQPFLEWFGRAQEQGELRRDIPIPFMLTILRGTAVATSDELTADRLEPDEAGRLLGEVLVSAFCTAP